MKRKIIQINTQAVIDILMRGSKQGQRVFEIAGVPETARYIGVWHDHRCDAFDIIVEDDSFPETGEGMVYQRVYVTVNPTK